MRLNCKNFYIQYLRQLEVDLLKDCFHILLENKNSTENKIQVINIYIYIYVYMYV